MTTVGPKMTAAKAYVALVGATLTAVTTALATVQLVLSDDAIDFAEYGTLATAAATLVGTIYGVWRTPNKPVSAGQGRSQDWN